MNLDTFHAFSDELQKTAFTPGMARRAARLGSKLEGAAVETGKILRDSAHPAYLGEGLKRGVRAMGNAPDSRKGKELLKELKHRQSSPDFDPRGALNRLADRFRSPEAAKKSLHAAQKAERVHKYVPDFHTGTGVTDWMRRQGLLSNTAKYEGPSKLRKARNMAARALPGELAVAAPLTAHGAKSDMKATEDPSTHKKPGLGERVGRTGLGLTTGIVGMRGGLVSGGVSAMLGHTLGARSGRALDTAARKIKGTVSGASPQPTGAS